MLEHIKKLRELPKITVSNNNGRVHPADSNGTINGGDVGDAENGFNFSASVEDLPSKVNDAEVKANGSATPRAQCRPRFQTAGPGEMKQTKRPSQAIAEQIQQLTLNKAAFVEMFRKSGVAKPSDLGNNEAEMIGSDTASTLFRVDAKHQGFGWITGVLIRCILCIFGATLFLRMSWMAGQAGLVLGFVVILLSLLIVTITAISMSAIATNGEVKSGGCYYLISRSLGPEFGGSIGLILYIANTVNASMNVVGLAETMVELLKGYGFQLIDGGKNDIRIYALAICLILQLIIFIGTEFENKTQLALMVTIVICILSHFIGTLLPISDYQRQRGIVGYSLPVLMDNLWPEFRNGETFIIMFGIYFPAMTGIMAGANMSGDLRDPSSSIPRGTFWAIAVTTAAYAWCMVTTAASTLRDATGDSDPLFDPATQRYLPPPCKANATCKYGLANDYQVMALQGAWAPLIVVGIFATTLSSASGCLIGAPRIFQALCADKLFPFVYPFAKGHGKNNDPFRAYILTLLIASSVILIGELNAIADLITNFFLAAFAITNFACFDASAAKSPGFRPGFHWFNKWLSLFGSALCVVTMFWLSWIISLITSLILLILFIFIKHNKSHINWGTSTDANRYRKALGCLLKITRTEEHVKNYRPQLLVLTGNPAARQALLHFAYCISNGQNLLLCGHVIPHNSSVTATALIRKMNNRFTDWLYDQRIKAFYCAVAHVSLRAGVQCLLQTVGLGKMQPNILLIGYNNKWLEQCRNDKKRYEEYVGVIYDAFVSNLSVCIFRNENEGLDHSALLSEEDQLFVKLPDLMLSDRNSSLNDDLNRGVEARIVRPKASARHFDEIRTNKSELNLHHIFDSLERHNSENNMRRRLSVAQLHGSGNSSANLRKYDFYGERTAPNLKFRTQIRGGFVDVWWLFDDGGLTLLLSYLLTTQNTYLPNAKLRVFTICSKSNPDIVHENLVKMLKKFRIHFLSVHVFCEDLERKLYQETLEEYDELMGQLNPKNGEKPAVEPELLESTHERTMHYLRQRELLLEFSSASSVVIITLPTANEEVTLSPIYSLWLELISRDMPPMLFVRGNQSSVITYYS